MVLVTPMNTQRPYPTGIIPLALQFTAYLRPLRPQVVAVVLLTLLTPLIGTALLWLFQKLVDNVMVGQQLHLLTAFLVAYGVVAALKFTTDYADQRLDAIISERIAQDVRIDVYRHLVSISPGTFSGRNSGDFLAHLTTDAERVSALIYGGPAGLVAHLAKALCFGAFLFYLSWKLTLAALVIVPLLAYCALKLSPKLRQSARIARHKSGAWMTLAEERLSALPLIHAFNAQRREVERFARTAGAARMAELRTISLQATMTIAVEAIAAAGALLVIGLAAHQVHSGALTLGGVLAFLGAIGSLYDPIRGITQSASRFQRAAASAERILSLLSEKSRVQERTPALVLTRPRGAIEFRDVSFGYAPGSAVLQKVSLRIEPGETVAVVGASGSGKSTLIRLLLRLHDPHSGTVCIDGVNVRDVTLASLRDAVGVVWQEPYVFRGSAAENIRYGEPHASASQVRGAAAAACADDFISATHAGYASTVGPRGEKLSGGQRSRIALARALLRDSPILVLDEATASIDSETEEVIQHAVEQLAGSRTLLIIGHRLSTVQHADRIVVLDSGRIVESGTPTALLKRGTRCHALFAAQLAEANASLPKAILCNAAG